MKRFILAIALAATVAMGLSGCELDSTGKGPHEYGILNEDAMKDPNWVYQVAPLNVIVGVIFCESIIVPIYVIGWDLYEPVRKIGTPVGATEK